MAKDYDSQLLESVTVRRRRLRDALLFGPGRLRREAEENTKVLLGSIVIAALLCAGCVGWAYISDVIADGGFGRSHRSAAVEEPAP
ncbi:membrane protein [Streptomyces xiamenensis]|uniref:Membrane protein n=1 Tax=Streptomyces xiamenensis TaxID=408015 RepID=A0A0F7CNI2_9ACTN|nr:hypothetical protein [Streptomyces xiamenensis]AKG42956.1 membrane protein [Streptomyces xiamenensis]